MFDGGWKFPDEHKMFAHLLEHRGYFGEMNVLGNQWMSRVTSHVSLRQALDQITGPAIQDAILLSTATMRRAGLRGPPPPVPAFTPPARGNVPVADPERLSVGCTWVLEVRHGGA